MIKKAPVAQLVEVPHGTVKVLVLAAGSLCTSGTASSVEGFPCHGG